jgi:hypothetical protein
MVDQRRDVLDGQVRRAWAPGGCEVTYVKLRFWYSVWGATGDIPSPSAMLEHLRPRVDGLVHEFEPDVEQWLSGRFRLSGSKHPAILVRRESPGHDEFLGRLETLEHVRRTQQVIHLVPCASLELRPSKMARMCEQLCGFLARTSDGLIQVYQEGFFSAEGKSLLPYCPSHNLKTT